MPIVNDFVLSVATVNGSGSQSANNILVKSIFRLGVPVCGKNLFPSNIAGLPTWFSIRANEKSYLSRKHPNDIVVAMNVATVKKDIDSLHAGGVFIYNSDLKFDEILLRKDVVNIGVPFKKIVAPTADSVKLKKFLTNIVYVGVLTQLLEIDPETVKSVIQDMFAEKPHVVKSNILAFTAGYEYAQSELKGAEFPYKLKAMVDKNKNKILIDGNTASALGLMFGGGAFMSWYPITPSSSLAEAFSDFCHQYRRDSNGENYCSVVQAEDELSAISMVIGAGWAGARAFTPTSGPGMSLMAEAAGLSYFAEIPAVIWNVQRVGPSTGLPTRTMQGDLNSAYKLSHGDTENIVLLPASPQECFEFGQVCFDLAEELQTLVIVLSDLDLGMNLWLQDEFNYPTENFKRGKVLSEGDLNKLEKFSRYEDKDGDGIPYRTLPGTDHPLAAYFTRGTGHDDNAQYSEDNENYRNLLMRLKKKHETAEKFVPQPVADINEKANCAFIAYGSTDFCMQEVRDNLQDKNVATSYLRLRALPLTQSVRDFIRQHDSVYVVEQNRDRQLFELIICKWPELAPKLKSINQFDGLPIASEYVQSSFEKMENLV